MSVFLLGRNALLGALGLFALARAAVAAQTVNLPDWVCSEPDAIYRGEFETSDATVPHDPSGGSGGAIGSITRTVHVAGLGSGTQGYYVYVPSNYTPAHAWPLLLALHGVAPYPGNTYAATIRNDWAGVADANGFIVAAPVAHEQVDVNGLPGVTWSVPPSSGPTDYDGFAAIRADLESAYNIERTRIYGWGFSAGAHVMHDLGINAYSTAFNASTMAAYGVSAGALSNLACGGLSDYQCGQQLAVLPRKIPVDIHLGDSDPLYMNSQYHAGSDAALFESNGWSPNQELFYTLFSGGHTYTVTQLGDIWHNLCPNAVIP